MKKILNWFYNLPKDFYIALTILFFVLYLTTICFAESYLIIKSDTKEVISLSPIDDAQLPSKDYQKIILSDNFKDIQLQYAPIYYKYDNKRFIVNIQKLSDEALAQQAAQVQAQDEQVIQAKIRKIAIDALTTDGVQLQSPANAQAQASMKAQTAQPVKAQ